MSVRYASCPGTFFSLPYVATIFAERSYAAGSMTPMPFDAGQMSALISFICQVWWPFGSAGPFASTVFTQSLWWSRHQIQPCSDAATNFFAVATFAGFLR